jgi:thioredoxin 1
VDFAAEWCGPCKRLSPIIHEIASHYDGKAKVAHLDVDNAPEIAAQFGIMSVPTVLLFKNGKKVSESVGLVPKERLEESIKANL